jgi:hypothetical protein
MVREALLEAVPEKKIVSRPQTESVWGGNNDQVSKRGLGVISLTVVLVYRHSGQKVVIGCHPEKFGMLSLL